MLQVARPGRSACPLHHKQRKATHVSEVCAMQLLLLYGSTYSYTVENAIPTTLQRKKKSRRGIDQILPTSQSIIQMISTLRRNLFLAMLYHRSPVLSTLPSVLSTLSSMLSTPPPPFASFETLNIYLNRRMTYWLQVHFVSLLLCLSPAVHCLLFLADLVSSNQRLEQRFTQKQAPTPTGNKQIKNKARAVTLSVLLQEPR